MEFSEAKTTIIEKMQKLQKEIDALATDLQSLNRIEGMCNPLHENKVTLIPERKSNLFTLPMREREISVAEIAWSAINSVTNGDPFTKNEIYQKACKMFPSKGISESSIGALLWNLEKRGQISLVEKGGGRRPSKYKAKASTDKISESVGLNLSAVNGTEKTEMT